VATMLLSQLFNFPRLLADIRKKRFLYKYNFFELNSTIIFLHNVDGHIWHRSWKFKQNRYSQFWEKSKKQKRRFFVKNAGPSCLNANIANN